MRVQPDLIKDYGQRTTMSHKKSKGKDKSRPCHMIYASTFESETYESSFFDTDDEGIPPTGIRASLAARTPCQKKF